MAVNLASKFSKYVDDAFEHECLLAGAVSSRVEFTGVNEVSVYSVDKMEMNDYNPSAPPATATSRSWGDRVQTFKIDRDRSFTGSIDEGQRAGPVQRQGRLRQAARPDTRRRHPRGGALRLRQVGLRRGQGRRRRGPDG